MKIPIIFDEENIEEIEEYGSLQEYLNDIIRDILDFDANDIIVQKEPYLISINDVIYTFDLIRGDCVESTNEHRIFSWSVENVRILERAIFKFNGGLRALLCSKCKVIIKIGAQFTEKELKAARGEIYLEPQYCLKCKK